MKEKIQKYIQDWENKCYSNGIPEEVPTRLDQLNKAPSYKKICMVILRNDFALQGLGFSKTKTKVYHDLKKIELSQRGKYNIQTKLKL